jgi:acetate kinase
MKILVVNTGSTSVKLDALEVDQDAVQSLRAERLAGGEHDPDEPLDAFLAAAGPLDAVAHRVVHGGQDLVESRELNAGIETRIEQLAELAPLHNPQALRWIRACRRHLNKPQVAVFDTAFFAAMPAVSRRYAVPREWESHYGIRRYGFHGIAHRAMWQRWCALRPDLPAGGRLITLQLGGGCSITAIQNGAPLDTSMGFSPAEGLVMATRCGDIDPGAILHLMRRGVMTPNAVEHGINEQSGLLGLSGTSAELRELVEDNAPQARLAVALYCYRIRKYIGAYQMVLGGVDGIVFGGGVGEHMPGVRARVLADLQWCGIQLDTEANQRAVGAEARISSDTSGVDVRVVPVDEAGILAREAYGVLSRQERRSP